MTGVGRRAFLGALGAAGAGVAVGGCGFAGIDLLAGQTGELLRSRARLPRPFTVPLPVPPVKEPTRTDGNADHYEIVQRTAEVEILPGLRTEIFGYDGRYPGPTIASRSGRRTVVRHRNQLPVPVVVHLHGGHTPPASDGYPIDLVRPSRERTYDYPLDQRAATLWYHDHRMGFTGPEVYRGLAGFHLVHDEEEAALPLPSGERDVPLMIADRAFEEDGSLRYPALDPSLRGRPGVRDAYMEGVLGDVVLVNGAPWPELEVAAARYRLRILNASNARRYRLALSPTSRGRPFVQVGSDGGLLARPRRHRALDVAPAERFDVVVDFSEYRPGTAVTMLNELGEGSTSRVLRFRVGRRVRDDSRVPDRLARVERIDPARAVRRRDWVFARGDVRGEHVWLINGREFDPHRMDARPRLGDVEIWRFRTDVHHPVHVHLDPFQVVSRYGGGTGEYDAGWKDTVDLLPGGIVDVAVRFRDYAGRYLLHCHNLEHEDMAMMAAFATR